MPTRQAEAVWNGDLRNGDGELSTESGALEETPYSFHTRFADQEGSNPEELIGAAHAGCFSMMLAQFLEENEYDPQQIHTHADVTIEETNDGPTITQIELYTDAEVPDIDEETFQDILEDAKDECPVSKALAGVDIHVDGELHEQP